jgi:hypothetical protein
MFISNIQLLVIGIVLFIVLGILLYSRVSRSKILPKLGAMSDTKQLNVSNNNIQGVKTGGKSSPYKRPKQEADTSKGFIYQKRIRNNEVPGVRQFVTIDNLIHNPQNNPQNNPQKKEGETKSQTNSFGFETNIINKMDPSRFY